MRTVWIALGLLILILLASSGFYWYTSMLYRQLQDSLDRLYKAVETESWSQADREVRGLEEIWARADDAWTPIMDHRQVDLLDESLTRVFTLVELRQKEELLLQLAVSRRLARRLKDMEVPGIGNIF